MKNLFSCLVHEKPDVIWDMVCNLRHLDPTSCVLLYSNSSNASLLEDRRFHSDSNIFIHPCPKPQPAHTLHGFMLDCMRWACGHVKFDAITNVDSDQLLLRPGYSERLAQIGTQHQGWGMLQSPPVTLGWPSSEKWSVVPLGLAGGTDGPLVINEPQLTALNEFRAWLPFLEKFDNDLELHLGGLGHYPKWTFWPATVFSRPATEAVLNLFDSNIYLRALIGRSRIKATEEIIFPTLVSLLGFELVQSPFDETCLRYKTKYSVSALEISLYQSNRFWMHPIPRDMGDPLRTHLRQHYRNYHQD